MAFVRKRTTKTGTFSTALVEAYRDENGRPRQRVLANLYGSENLLEGLAKVAVMRERLRSEKAAMASALSAAAKNYEAITIASMNGHKFTATDRTEIDSFLTAHKRLVNRAEKIDSALVEIHRHGAAITKHVTASNVEIQAAIKTFKEQIKQAEATKMSAYVAQTLVSESPSLGLPAWFYSDEEKDHDKKFVKAMLAQA